LFTARFFFLARASAFVATNELDGNRDSATMCTLDAVWIEKFGETGKVNN